MRTTASVSSRCSSVTSGRNRAGSVSSCSRNTPSAVILPSACRSAEQDTAIATGQDAPCRGSRTTRTSWQKYLPPNCAPMPKLRVSSSTCASSSTSRKPCAVGDPVVGNASRYFADAYFAVFSANSALVPPTTIARWYGGQAAVPRARSFSSRKVSIRSGFRTALVSWYRNDLLALPPPLAMNRNLYAGSAAGRCRVDLDLRRQVGAGVLLVPHRQRGQLRVAQVEPGVRVVHALADRLGVVAAGEHPLALLAHHDRGAGVLAHRQYAGRADVGVLQQVERDEAVVAAAVGVVDDAAELGEVRGPQVVGDVVHRLVGQPGERLRCDPEEPLAAGLEGLDAVAGHEPVLGLVGSQREQVGVGELGHRRRSSMVVGACSAVSSGGSPG